MTSSPARVRVCAPAARASVVRGLNCSAAGRDERQALSLAASEAERTTGQYACTSDSCQQASRTLAGSPYEAPEQATGPSLVLPASTDVRGWAASANCSGSDTACTQIARDPRGIAHGTSSTASCGSGVFERDAWFALGLRVGAGGEQWGAAARAGLLPSGGEGGAVGRERRAELRVGGRHGVIAGPSPD